MKRILLPLLLSIAMLVDGSPAAADQAPAGVSLERPWARASIGTSRPAAAFVTIVNRGEAPARLIEIGTPLAGRAEIHRTVTSGNVMRMEPVAELDIHPGERLVFEPGGLHVMLLDLRSPLKKGEDLTMTLRFAGGGAIETSVPIYGPGAQGPEK